MPWLLLWAALAVEGPLVVVAEAESAEATVPAPEADPLPAVKHVPLNLSPSAKRSQREIVQQLQVQAALRDARRDLNAGQAHSAIAKLEPLLAHAGGSDLFLATLDQAYQARIAELIRAGQAEEAATLSERRLALGAETTEKKAEAAVAPTPAPPTSVEPPAAARAPRAAAPAPRPAPPTPTPSLGGAGGLFGKLLGGSKSTGPAKPPDTFVARAKMDDPLVVPASAKGKSPEDAELAAADQHWKRKEYAHARKRYQAAYAINPSGKVQQYCNRFGYCILRTAFERFAPMTVENPGQVPAHVWRDWEAEVRQGRQLVNLDSYRKYADEQLQLIAARRGMKSTGERPVSTRDAGSANGWRLLESPNFVVHHRNPALAEEIAQLAEAARRRAHELWFPGDPQEDWANKARIVLYPTQQEFTANHPEMPGSPALTLCDVQPGYVASRTLVFRADEPNLKHAILPHEVCHAVLAGQFAGQSPPKWADEGLAVLTEPEAKQREHLRGLVRARAGGQGFSCHQAMMMTDYPQGRMPEFYAQSVGMCKFLAERGGRPRLVAMIRQALQSGDYNSALLQHFGITDFNAFEREFRGYLAQVSSDLAAGSAVAAR